MHFESIRDQVNETRYQAAHTELKKLLDKNSRLSSYERAQIWNLTGYTFYLEDNYPKAVDAYQQVLKQGGPPGCSETQHPKNTRPTLVQHG